MMNINFRKSFRRSTRSSTFYLESFEMYDRAVKHLSLENVNQYSSNSVPMIDFRNNETMILIKPIASVFKYDLNSERSTGTVGQIILTNFRLRFIPYSQESGTLLTVMNHNGRNKSSNQFNFPPFELVNKNKMDEDVEYLNINGLMQDHNMLQIYCSDFRCLEFQFRSSSLVKNLIDQLERLVKPINFNPINYVPASFSSSMTSINTIAANRDFELAYFWTIIATQYQFNYPKDWESNEGYWYSTNNLLRISQANENYQLCKSLPVSFITLKYYLTDVNLLHQISAKMRGQRVPIITYSCKCKSKHQSIVNRFNKTEKNNMLIRSGIIDKEVTYSLKQAINPLNIIEVNEYLPDSQNFISIYLKLSEACFLYSNTTHFLSQIGKWIKLVCKVLSLVNDLSKILQEESSLLLMESNDNHWNLLLSCLIQITLDRKRRTIEGFNSLLSKEWVYLVGLRNSTKLDHKKLPNQLLFTLLLDCVYQMLVQNPNEFEFTSLYLIRCFDLSFIPYSAFVTFNNINKREESEQSINLIKKLDRKTIQKFSPIHLSRFTSVNTNFNLNSRFCVHSTANNSVNNVLSPILKNLKFTQTLFYFNPFYSKCKLTSSKLTFSSNILVVKFWRPFYLRWSKPCQNLEYYNQFHFNEYLYFKELISSDLKHIEQSTNEDNNIDMSDNLEYGFEHF